MKIKRLTTLTLLALAALAACSREKVQPEGADAATGTATPEQLEARKAADYKKRQEAFADSVLKSSVNTRQIAAKLGDRYQVGSLQMRDSLVKWVERTPQCYHDGKDVDPYLAGTVTFRIHMAVTGSDNVRVQESKWTSQAGNVTDKCFNDAAVKWTFPMGMAKQGFYLLQVQFK